MRESKIKISFLEIDELTRLGEEYCQKYPNYHAVIDEVLNEAKLISENRKKAFSDSLRHSLIDSIDFKSNFWEYLSEILNR